MARCVQGFHFDVLADGEGLAVAWGGGDLVAVLAADDGKGVALEEFDVAASMVVVAGYLVSLGVFVRMGWWGLLVSVDDVCQLDTAICSFL